MHVQYFVFLLMSCWICYSDALVSKKVGAEQEQNKNDPKYQKMANELVQSYLHVKDKDLQNVTVNKVTLQVVSGTITTLQLQVFLINGKSSKCQFKILDQKWKAVKYVSHKCDSLFSVKKLSFGKHSRPRSVRDPNNPKYKLLARVSIDTFFKNPGYKPFKKEDIKQVFVTSVEVKINSKIKTLVTFNVVTVKNEHFKCTSGLTETPWLEEKPENFTHIKCTIDGSNSENKSGGQEPQNPNDPKYNNLAKKCFDSYLQSHGYITYKHLKVTKVTTQVVIGVITRMDFTVYPTKGESFSCHSEILEQKSKNHNVIKVTCDKQKSEPDNVDFQNLVKESFEKYQETNGIIKVKDFKINKVVAGLVTRIFFTVIPKRGTSFPCQSEIVLKKKVQRKNIKVTCEKEEHHHGPGREVLQNPEDPKYKNLAIKSIHKYEKIYGFIDVKELKVTKVTTQVVSGTLTRIDFNVVTTKGQSFPCHSEIFEKMSFRHKNITVTCKKQQDTLMPGGDEPKNPDNPKYKQLAEEAFEKYQETHGTIMINELKVTKVTQQIVSGVITRIQFAVISTEGDSFSCHTEIIIKNTLKKIKVNCEKQENVPIPGGEVPQNPNNLEFKQLAEEAFEKFQETYGTIKVKEFKVTKVTTQVVSGVITRIQFAVISTEDASFSCHSEIIIKNTFKRIKVNCEKQENDPTPGGEVPKNPDDPKYKQLAEEAFEKYQETRGTIMINELKVIKVTQQVVSGVITRIQFAVISTEGSSFSCHSEIVENLFKRIKVNCEKQESDPIPGGEVPQNPANPKFKQLAEEAFENFQETYGTIKVKEFKVTKVTTQVVSGVITRIQFAVISTEGDSFSCRSEIIIKNTLKKIKVNCEKQENVPIPGGEVPQNPNNPKFKQLAEEAFENFQETYGTIKVKEFKVTKVTTQVVSGVITRIQFAVISTEDASFSCHSEIIIKNTFKRIKVNCEKQENDPIPGGEVPKNPDDPKYKQLAEEAFEKYQETRGTIMINELKVTKVTQQVVSGVITRIQFAVISTEGSSFSCHSEIVENLFKRIKVNCEKQESDPIPGGEVPQNPANPKFKQLAEEAFENFQETYGTIKVKEFKVTKVTTQVVSGVITRIQFAVISTEGDSFSCRSEIIIKNTLKKIKVNCEKQENVPIPGGEVPQNPNNPEFKQLAEEAFDNFQETYGTIKVKEFKVTKVTTQVVSGVITRIQFAVISTEGASFSCHSEIIIKNTFKKFKVNCEKQDNNSIPGGEVSQNPNNPKYTRLAEEAFKKFQETYTTIMIKNFVVTKVTTQVVSGVITRIHFSVTSTKGQLFLCYSEILQKNSVASKNIKIKCEKLEHASLRRGGVPQNPKNPVYKQLAIDAIEKLKEIYGTIIIIQLKVIKVTTHIDFKALDFYVLSTEGQLFSCNSQIVEQNVIRNNHITVLCTTQNNLNLDDPKYLDLAKESFKKFQEDCGCSFFHIKRYKMTRVNESQTPSNKGLLTKIHFLVILNSGKSFPCHSEIYEDKWPYAIKYLEANCQVPYGLKFIGMSHSDGKSGQKYQIIAKQAIKHYFETCLDFRHLTAKRIEIKNVSSVLTRMSQTNISYINVQAFAESVTGNNLLHDCSVVYETENNRHPIFTACVQEDKKVLMPERVRDPSDEKYLAFAEKSVQELSETSKNIGEKSKYEIIVTFVVTKDSKIFRAHRMKFVVRMLSGPEYNCSSKVTESFSDEGKNIISDVQCLV